MTKKDGEREKALALKEEKATPVDKDNPSQVEEIYSDTDIQISTSLNEDLEELLEKDTKRFFGGCGG